jgi:hypothetical protein
MHSGLHDGRANMTISFKGGHDDDQFVLTFKAGHENILQNEVVVI